MQKIIIIGAGGHAAEIDEYLGYARERSDAETPEVIGFLDDNAAGYDNYQFSAPYLGAIRGHTIRQDVAYLMGIANLVYRRPIIELFLQQGANFATFIHPGAYVSRSAVIGRGVVIAPNVNIGPNVRLGDFNLLNARCSIGHDTTIGHYNFISPNVCFSGFTEVGDENLFGINSATIPGIRIGSRNKIAAGMTLDKPVGDDTTVFYRFKEKVMAIPKG